MRLQLQVHRHSFPPVHIIHSTGTGPASRTAARNSTIADLLLDINDIVPLESADGEWGLEDYVVEVAATVDQDATYECLHYQPCSAVLRDDDEVIIRPLSNEDLRIRRLGGRHQITADGRHLIDGVTFGKQWLREISRPGIVIPPRKKRMLEIDQPGLNESPEIRRILPLEQHDYSTSLVVIPSDDDDESDDEDFVDEDDNDNDRQVALREHFDDADTQSDESLEDSAAFGESVDDMSNEVQLLLQDAAELANSPNSKTTFRTLRKQLKRKRDISDDGEDDIDEVFDGFSTPVKSYRIEYSPVVEPEDDTSSDEDDESESDSASSSGGESDSSGSSSASTGSQSDSDSDSDSGSDSGSDSDSEPETDSDSQTDALHQAKQRALNHITLSRADQMSESDSSETSDEAASRSDGRRSPANEDQDSTSESESTSDSDETSSSEETSASESESETEPSGKKQAPAAPSKTALEASEESPKTDKLTVAPVSAPGEGSSRTHQNNARVKKRKRLALLKSQGILPENADFQTLHEYEQQLQANSTGTDEAVARQQETANSKEGLADLGEEPEAPVAPSQEPLSEGVAQPVELSDSQVSGGVPVAAPESETPAPRRARLDLASSRRMLFSSLGLRTPKDKAAEQALREKLSALSQPRKAVDAPPNPTRSFQAAASEEYDDSWKNSLSLSAVECEREGMTLSTPPFPFQQGWWKGKKPDATNSKSRGRDESRMNHDDDHNQSFAPDVSTLGYANDEGLTSSMANPSQSHSDAVDNIQVPVTFNNLPDLLPSQLRPGAVVAYKQLQLDESTNYQPEVSAYVVGRITAVDADELEICLAKQFWKDASSIKFDPETGKRVLGKFEMELDDGKDESDDGLRRVDFSAMITPKLIESSPIEVPDSGHNQQILNEQDHSRPTESEFICVPESEGHEDRDSIAVNPTAGEGDLVVNTPRRTEITAIIKEAGFDSALDDDLLEPIVDPSAERKGSHSSVDAPPSKQGNAAPNLGSASSPAHTTNDPSSPPENDGKGSLNLHHRDDQPLLASDDVSSPYVHTQETVDYPHISQIELDSFEATKNNSSSHQDAQRTSAEPPVDLSFSSEYGSRGSRPVAIEASEPSQEYQGLYSLRSDLPQSSSPSHGHLNGDNEAASRNRSFLGGRGYDGQDSSYLDDDDDRSSSERSLPSVRALTSSQLNGRPTRLSIKGEHKQPVSPPPIRKSLRSSQAKLKQASQSSPELPDAPSSQPDLKLSQSQQQPGLSQIPAGSQMIDLTLSSDASSPVKRSTKKGAAKSNKDAQANGNRASISSLPNPGAGIGTRRLLTKKRSYV
ncbi:hypothetical protein PV10_01106 [Exophiala mesophila]|uniref:Uncharacterized protein n=1 Tax=Exophiala mesophila TaxID=212818 RepID=A0A0D1ZTT7_EXOME|nr:uncharacterized protein PV10_01106 [Exophiala mesophila]KIV97344.1 hypothetical protein PV10_01106 [Exophiala mesophila]